MNYNVSDLYSEGSLIELSTETPPAVFTPVKCHTSNSPRPFRSTFFLVPCSLATIQNDVAHSEFWERR
jgi:hypothetical protein